MRLIKIWPVLFLLSCITLYCNAQDDNDNNNCNIHIPEVALLNLKSASQGTVNLSPGNPGEAGASLNFESSSQSDIWINYSSIINNGINSSRGLLASVSGEIPEGILLKVYASEDAGTGGGRTGIPTGTVILSEAQQEIISGIGSCFTGAGINKGHKLTYYLEPDESAGYSKLQNKSCLLTVTFTLSECY